jgi:hypothetical protein
VSTGIEEQEAVLLMDNCPSHITGDVMDLLTAPGVRVVTLAPHTMQIFQLLNLTLFEIFKQDGKYRLPFDELTTTTNFVYNVYVKLTKTLTPPNTWTAFNAIGVIFNTGATPYRIVFHPEKLRESQGFAELWNIDYPLVSLRSRRRNARFG